MSKSEIKTPSPEGAIHGHGLRMTDQRRAVYEALMAQRDHPSAVDIFTRVRIAAPHISLATVYNCLETMTECGLVKTVTHERGPSRYCANLEEHAHFFCESCGDVQDIPLRNDIQPKDIWQLPKGATISQQAIAFRGVCPKCASKKKFKIQNPKSK